MRTRIILALVAVLVISSIAFAKKNSVPVCHQEGNGTYHIININQNGLDAHIKHGDWLVGEEVCGDEVDNDCDGLVDGDDDCVNVCPCFTAEGVVDYISSFGGTCVVPPVCDLEDQGQWEIWTTTTEGLATAGVGQWVCDPDYGFGPCECWIGSLSSEINWEQYQSCTHEIWVATEMLGLTCGPEPCGIECPPCP